MAARRINDSMPEYVLARIAEIMNEHQIKSLKKVGIYGLTYKENVDDVRESPTLQLLESMRTHLSSGIAVYDPFVKDTITANQYQSFERFLDDVDMIVIMVGHSHIIENMEAIKDKIILDTRNVCKLEKAYKL